MIARIGRYERTTRIARVFPVKRKKTEKKDEPKKSGPSFAQLLQKAIEAKEVSCSD